MKGVFVGRLCPIHIGHEVIIRALLDRCGFKDTLLILGMGKIQEVVESSGDIKNGSAV